MPSTAESDVTTTGPGTPLVSDHAGAVAPKQRLRGLSDIRRFFYRNDVPVYFISATNFNLLGMDEWIRQFTFINFIDCFDGRHPNVFVPEEIPHEPFTSIEDINNYLLSHKEVIDFLKSRGGGGKAVFLMFDEDTEALCREAGLEVAFPPAALRQRVDDKLETTRIADRAGVESVPNVLARVDSWSALRRAAEGLGDDLVIQTAYGDSGHTTFFVSSEDDWREHGEEIAAAPEVKIMKRIRCRGAALEACVTRHGTIVGPLMTELVGFPELTPYRGGWCGNEVFADAFSREIRDHARRSAFAFGEELRKLDYLGYFELDFLTDLDSDRVYLGECNPRITGASSMTNLAAFCHADAPLFLFHLLEWMDVDFELDVEALNERWADPDNIDTWSQLVIKHVDDSVDRIVEAPASGIWQLDDDGARYVRPQTHRRTVQFENRAFYLRISGAGDYRYEGADLGILVSPGRFMDEDFQLNERARRWIDGIRGHYRAEPIAANDAGSAATQAEVGGFKMMQRVAERPITDEGPQRAPGGARPAGEDAARLELDFRSVREPRPGPRWAALFEEFWPAYRRWFLSEGDAARPRYARCRRELERHMPEMVPAWNELAELAGGGDAAARFLSLYRPPPYLSGCSQAIWARGDEVALVRNYDYAPRLCDGVVLASAWRGAATIATTDCLVGALDGMNEHGLAVALAFGGRRLVGDGFGIAIVLRYVLETCATTAEAAAVLERVPVHMTYTVAVVDRAGNAATVYVAPDRPTRVTPACASTNHQDAVEWAAHARLTGTVERRERLEACLAQRDASLDGLVDRFLEPPLFQRAWSRGSGTLYTSICWPREDRVEYRWPDHRWSFTFEDFPEMTWVARFGDDGSG